MTKVEDKMDKNEKSVEKVDGDNTIMENELQNDNSNLVKTCGEKEDSKSPLVSSPIQWRRRREIPIPPASSNEDNAKTGTSSISKPGASSPDKRVIHLNPGLSNIFKSPLKTQLKLNTSSAVGGGAEETPTSSRGSVFLEASLALAAALKSESKKKVFCANSNCNVKTDTVLPADSLTKIYFGIERDVNFKICMGCSKKADIFKRNSKDKLMNKECLFDLKCEIQAASADNMINLDSPVGSPGEGKGQDGARHGEPSEGQFYQVDIESLEQMLKKKLKIFDAPGQIDKCKQALNKEIVNLTGELTGMDEQMEQLRLQIEGLTKTYNDHLAYKPTVFEIGAVDIDLRGNIAVKPNDNLTEAKEELNRVGNMALNKAMAELKSIENVRINTEDEECKSPTRDPPMPAPGAGSVSRRVGKLIFAKPKQGQDVFAMHKHSLFYWLPAKIIKINISNLNSTVYTVKFQEKVRPRNKGINEADCYTKDVNGKQLAFKKASSVVLPVGTRIIGKFKDLLKTDAEVDGRLYAGVIAEIPRQVNRMRYLVFFDDGYAQYVAATEVFPVVESAANVWDDVHINSQDFIREYVVSFPNRHMIRAEIGATFTVELNGDWLLAKIAEVDCSLLKIQYMRKTDSGMECEWVYRGSTRLGPLYNRLKALQARPTLTVARRHTYSSRRTNFSFEVNRDGDGIEEVTPTNNNNNTNKVARKRTGCDGVAAAAKGGIIRAQNGMVISTVLESAGNMIKIQIPLTCPTSRAYQPHTCSVKCAYRYDEEKLRKVSPLAIPFYLGWAREMAGPDRKNVFYRTPCGLRLGSYFEIHNYIAMTASEIHIDFFSLEPTIDCLNEFEPIRRIAFLKDVSYGKEWTPVPCVNSLDHDLPAYMEYMTERIAGKGVVIDEDDDFLVCCDCENDCQDKDKCACWQLTLSGISFKLAAQEGSELKGYENRRLKNHVLSGIYECNRKCKCRSTCFNRVVQNKVKWPIQMFKTVAKGWGVRALHDMPKGSFICVYTGQLLTDAGANESGIEVGDEYLAELDFIECNEQIKEDYESDCTDIENEAPGTKSTARLKANGTGAGGGQSKQNKVAKKSTIQKAVKSTGGLKRRQEEDQSGYLSDASTICCFDNDNNSSRPSPGGGHATARKSGSRNGIAKAASEKHKSLSSSSPSGLTLSNGAAVSTRSHGSRSKAESEVESDEDVDVVQVYSSFSASVAARHTKNAPRLPLREYFGKDEAVYIMDAKSMGNFGRYLNHSCEPNVFIQNLFVDTHDPRFPWVAFFTKHDVKAGTELTWDYNYEIESVPTKTLFCYCLTPSCRGRLL